MPNTGKKNLAEWMSDPELMKEVAARSGGKIKLQYLILPAETYGEAKRLRAALEREAGCPGIVDHIHRLSEALPRLEDRVPCPYALAVTSETLAKKSPELLARARALVPHPSFVKLTRVGERAFHWCCGRLADLLGLLIRAVHALKSAMKGEKNA